MNLVLQETKLRKCKRFPSSPTKGLDQYRAKMKRSGFRVSVLIGLCFAGCETLTLPDKGSETVNDITSQLEKHEDVSGALNPFPLIENPGYVSVAEKHDLRDDDLVFICKSGGDIRVFSRRDMYVEVVNTQVNGFPVAITYCPITRSGIAWNRVLGADTLLLTASGYLYKENLMPLDVNSGNIWSQMLMRRFQGDTGMGDIFAFTEISTFPLIETTWLTVKDHFPEAQVFTNSGGKKSAGAVPGEQQLGIIGLKDVLTYSKDLFPGEINLHKSAVNPGGAVVVAGSSLYHYMLAFRTTYMMEPVEGQFPFIMRDETGTLWNIFGEGKHGAHDGERLEIPRFYTAADWAWRDLFEQVRPFEP
jgi:hypothetical protein